MIIKVCGLREAENIREVMALPVDMIGFDFRPDSERLVKMISSRAGIIPDYSEQRLREAPLSSPQGGEALDASNSSAFHLGTSPLSMVSVGVFADDMPQNIITRIYNYQLDAVQLDGSETAVMISNLRRSVVPDIAHRLMIIKTIRLKGNEDFLRWKEYEGEADWLRFECASASDRELLSLRQIDLSRYNGTIPFLLSGGIGLADAAFVKSLRHPLFVGIDLNECFETAPAVKDIEKLRRFIHEVKPNS